MGIVVTESEMQFGDYKKEQVSCGNRGLAVQRGFWAEGAEGKCDVCQPGASSYDSGC